jgi:dTDP-4-dehydrorhamnose reductase
MKILLTGATGLLGPAFARIAAAAGHEIVGVSAHHRDTPPGVTRLVQADLTDRAAVARLLAAENPAAIVNAAAIADPAACDRDPLGSEVLNVVLPALLAAHCARHGRRLVHLSSEQVFDGEHPPFAIASRPSPLHLYGHQKAESERVVLGECPDAAVVRAPLLLGNSPGGRRSPHEQMFALWMEGRPARLYTDELRQVCTADSLAAVLLELLERRELTGVLHWAGAKPVSRWELGRAIVRQFGLEEKWIQPVSRRETPEISARRPRDLTLDLAPLDRVLRARPEPLAQAMAGLIVPAHAREWLARQV